MAKILWIDDYAGKGNSRRIGFDALIYFVEKNGHQVQIASTSLLIEEALARIDSYDLVILDIIMDPLSSSTHANDQYGGIDALERLAGSQAAIPIIVVSVMPARKIRDEVRRRGLDLDQVGVKEIKRKGSLTPTELATLVEQYLAKKPNAPSGVPQ